MNRDLRKVILVSAVAAFSAMGVAAAASAQSTPNNWNWKISKDGKRVPKTNRMTSADGSWREELRQGNCVTLKEGKPAGEVKTTRRCN